MYHVPDALSRMTNLDNPSDPVEEDLPCFSNSVLITTRSGAENAQTNLQPGGSKHSDIKEEPENLLSELDDFDLVDLATGEGHPTQDAQSEDLPMPLTKHEILEEQ